ncbi:hypothetical protein [Aeromonas media]|uniref:hypothetical protein n=1 Tax=Aeromonas media TaxID=651 RepID=UPI003D1E7A3C
MKRFILGAVLAVCAGTVWGQQLSNKYPNGIDYVESYDARDCSMVAHQANITMKLRLFYGEPRAKALETARREIDWSAESGEYLAATNGLIRVRLIHEAYQKSIPDSDEGKSQLVNEFESSVMKRCLGRS